MDVIVIPPPPAGSWGEKKWLQGLIWMSSVLGDGGGGECIIKACNVSKVQQSEMGDTIVELNATGMIFCCYLLLGRNCISSNHI
jgi:hypothetical protein